MLAIAKSLVRECSETKLGTKIDLKLIDNDQVAGFYLPGYPCEDIMDLPASVIGSTSQIN